MFALLPVIRAKRVYTTVGLITGDLNGARRSRDLPPLLRDGQKNTKRDYLHSF